MSNETRPFEVGDLVVLKNGKTSIVIKEFPDGFWIEPVEMTGNIWIDKHNEFAKIKTIRKPRKGSKEARDIVAMLKWEYKNARYVTGDTDISGVLAEKAKSMLK